MKEVHIFSKQVFMCLMTLLFWIGMRAQETFPYNGVRPRKVTAVAITHVQLYIDANTVVEDATLVLEQGRVVAAGKDIRIPANAVVMDMQGMTIYPSFIDLDSDYGMPVAQNQEERRRGSQMESNVKGAFGWNEAIHSEYNAAMRFQYQDDKAKELRNIGFGTVLSHVHDGIVRGTSAVVTLGKNEHDALLKPNAAAHFSFNKGSSRQDYPSSLMGSIALLRQTYYDAVWYANGGVKEERNLSLQAFNELRNLPAIFEAGDKWNVLRADKIGDEFQHQYIFRGAGDEYQRIQEMKATNGTFIIPLNFPEAIDVSDPYLSRMVSLEELKHWELAPYNCSVLQSAGISFCITSAGLSDKSVFLKNLRKAVESGLSEKDALYALTMAPARLIGMEGEVGALKPGMVANFIVVKGNIFSEKSQLKENWIQGERFVIESTPKYVLRGQFNLELPKATYQVRVDEIDGKTKSDATIIKKINKEGKLVSDTSKVSLNFKIESNLISFTFQPSDSVYKGVLRFAGAMGQNEIAATGTAQDESNQWFTWTLKRTNVLKENAGVKDDKKKEKKNPGAIIYPFVAYGYVNAPQQETVLIKNATVWTNEQDSLIENGQVLISGGKIVAVGKMVDASKYPGIKIVDAQGKHVTPGIIDEHSHIAVASVNEGTQASSAEVQEASVIWPEDIDIYRQLSGGVTAAQLLHGSANPIGGQSALVKMRWGVTADKMLIEGAPGFIKFALGENVKQSNWGDQARERFPQTRMGVEQVYYDYFIRAREYGEAWVSFNPESKVKGAPTKNIRRDLELDALYEILQHRRFITCHSYVQSEINMLMHVADSMGFKINTFTHILEGYKVADKLKEHGANASTFSDWWAYKMEVRDAIPYNGALMWRNGLNVAFNSDDAEMGRRLNQEAAKAVKYGNVPETEALKFVTLNPAKMLRLDNRMGSLKAGKDADLVVWSDHPLSVYAKVEKTYVDGICYYDAEQDKAMRLWIEAERARIIQLMLNAGASGEPMRSPSMKEKKHFHCDTLDETSLGIFFKQ